ncbi:MAG: transposase [Bacteroidetes bacterium]|nr:transposase [Bacteroidota bacterium]
MSKKLQYREPNRFKKFDYSKSAYYFVTICVEDLIETFGQIDKTMHVNEFGIEVEIQWKDLVNLFDVSLDEYIIMPDHIHGIIILEESNDQSLFTIVNTFKSNVEREIRKTLPSFAWENSFFDRVLHNDNELCHVRNYIQQNVQKWEEERNQENNS